MSHDQVHTQSSNLSKIPDVDPQKISQIQHQTVFEFMHTSASGFSNAESESRIQVYGNNAIQSKKSFHPVQSFAKQLVNLMAIMLWAASILALISGTPLLSYVIWFIIIINAIFSFFQEQKADKALQSLSKMIPNNVKVYRDGEMMVLSADKLVPGDVVTLRAGDKVPADIRIIAADGLSVDNSMLTGESVPVDRDEQADPLEGESITNSRNLLFAGTSITGGNAKGVVYATGKNSQIGNITQSSAEIVRSTSTLENQIRKITRILVIIALFIGALAFLISTFVTGFSVNAALIFAIGIIVANIPEGLMPTVSLSLAMGVQRMAHKKALVRKQSAVETLSSTSVICTDKTGTLTQNAMFATKVWTIDGMVDISGEGYGKKGSVTAVNAKNKQTLERLFAAATICSDTVLSTDQEDHDKWKMIGNPTEAAILIAAEKFGMKIETVKEQFERTKVIPFSSNTKTMTVLAENHHNTSFPSNQVLQFTKGDPGKLIDHCSFIFKDGQVASCNTRRKTTISCGK